MNTYRGMRTPGSHFIDSSPKGWEPRIYCNGSWFSLLLQRFWRASFRAPGSLEGICCSTCSPSQRASLIAEGRSPVTLKSEGICFKYCFCSLSCLMTWGGMGRRLNTRGGWKGFVQELRSESDEVKSVSSNTLIILNDRLEKRMTGRKKWRGIFDVNYRSIIVFSDVSFPKYILIRLSGNTKTALPQRFQPD